MIVPNLAVDHMAAAPLARTADLLPAMERRNRAYGEAAKKMGLSHTDFDEMVGDLDLATYGALPRNIDVMAGRKPSGRVYVLHNVLVPAHTMGWYLRLHDGVRIYIPQVCGNLSADFPPRRAPVATVPFHNVSYKGYAPTPVVFVPPSAPPGSSAVPPAAPVDSAPPVASGTTGHRFSPFWLAPLAVIPWLIHGASAPPCSQGSNVVGACAK